MCVGWTREWGGVLFATTWGESVQHLTNSAVIHRISCVGIVSENTNFCTIKTDFLWREKGVCWLVVWIALYYVLLLPGLGFLNLT